MDRPSVRIGVSVLGAAAALLLVNAVADHDFKPLAMLLGPAVAATLASTPSLRESSTTFTWTAILSSLLGALVWVAPPNRGGMLFEAPALEFVVASLAGLAGAALVALALVAATTFRQPQMLNRPLVAAITSGALITAASLLISNRPPKAELILLVLLFVGPPVVGVALTRGRGVASYAAVGGAASAGSALVFAVRGISSDLDSAPQFIFTLWFVTAFVFGLIGVLAGGVISRVSAATTRTHRGRTGR